MIGRMLLRFSPIALVLVAAACGGGGGTKTVTVTQTITPTATAPHSVAARIYLVRDGRVSPVARDLSSKDPAQLILALARGPNKAERAAGFSSVYPSESRLSSAQAVYTLTQFAPSDSFVLQGKTYTRADFEDETPLILVESPLPFQTVHSPLRVTGTANTFEATFNYDLVDQNGKVIAHHFVTATSGSGTRGTFDFTVPFTVAQGGPGKLVVYELSAKDGSRVHQVEIPLTLEP